MYYDQAEAIYFNAYRKGIMVGRISGILQKASNIKWAEKRVRFTRFDSIDDQEVANALFQTIEKWALSKDMDTVVGPLGFSDLEREGLLIEGFDQLSTFEEQYNYDYYQKLLENYGYVKEVDWLERKIWAPAVVDDRLERLSSLMMRRYKLHFGESKNTKDFLKRYSNQFFEILDETYKNLYGTVPYTDGMKKMIIASFRLIVDTKHAAVIVDENDKVVCFGICLPSIAKALQKSQGHLTIPALLRLLKAIKKPEVIDLALIGVLPEYQMKGIGSVFIAETMKMLQDGQVKYAETNLNLEDNVNIQNQWKNFDSIQHKRRRCFVKKLM